MADSRSGSHNCQSPESPQSPETQRDGALGSAHWSYSAIEAAVRAMVDPELDPTLGEDKGRSKFISKIIESTRGGSKIAIVTSRDDDGSQFEV